MNINTYKKYYYTNLAITLFSFFFILIRSYNTSYQYLSLIPLFYIVCNIIFNKIHKYSFNNTGLLILNIVLFIKYVIANLFVAINSDFDKAVFTGVVPSASSISHAILLIIIEMIAIFVSIHIFSEKFYKDKNNSETNFEKVKIGNVIILFIILSIILIIIYPTRFLPPNFFEGIDSIEIVNSDGISLILNAFKLLLSGILINYFIVKYEQNKSIIFIFLSYLTLLIYILLVSSTSRINMLLPLLFFYIITKNVFGKKGKIIMISIIAIMSVLIINITIYKSMWLFLNNNDNKLIGVVQLITQQIQEYTSGIRPVALGIEMTKKYSPNINIITFFNDCLGSIPVISNFINQNNRINVYYNLYVRGNAIITPLIIPMVNISSSYFTEIFCWILSVLNIIILMHIDSKKQINNTYIDKYMKLYILFILATCVFSNTQMIIGRIVTRYLPVIIILYLNKKIVWKREKNEQC